MFLLSQKRLQLQLIIYLRIFQYVKNDADNVDFVSHTWCPSGIYSMTAVL